MTGGRAARPRAARHGSLAGGERRSTASSRSSLATSPTSAPRRADVDGVKEAAAPHARPTGKIPALSDDDFSVSDSVA